MSPYVLYLNVCSHLVALLVEVMEECCLAGENSPWAWVLRVVVSFTFINSFHFIFVVDVSSQLPATMPAPCAMPPTMMNSFPSGTVSQNKPFHLKGHGVLTVFYFMLLCIT